MGNENKIGVKTKEEIKAKQKYLKNYKTGRDNFVGKTPEELRALLDHLNEVEKNVHKNIPWLVKKLLTQDSL